MSCEYEHWNRETGTMETCDADTAGKRMHYIDCVGREYELCAFHLAFVDYAKGTFSKRKKESHPADWNWLKKARQAYGIKACNLGSAFPYGIPASAGPAVRVWARA